MPALLCPLWFPEAYEISKNKLELIKMLMEMGSLHSSMVCNCGSTMGLVERPDKSNGYCWRCISSQCRKQVSIRRNSFFAGHKLELGTIFIMIYSYLQFPKML